MPIQNPYPAYGAHLMAYAGITSFMRQPLSRDLAGVDVAIVGVPYDGGTTSYRSGARFGPRKIREASVLLWGHNYFLGITPLEVLALVDYGDVAVNATSIEKTMEVITAEVRQILADGPTVISLGGDHSISLPLLRAHAEKFGPLAIVQFDSHSDTSDREYDHGTPFRHAIQEGLIDPAAYIQIGIRGPKEGPEDVAGAEALGVRVLTIDTCFEMGIPGVLAAVQDLVRERPVYVSLDIDAVDPAYAPATGTPEVGGFTSYQILQLVRGLDGLNLVGFDLVEVSPPYDHADITSILAANLVFEFLSLLARKQGA